MERAGPAVRELNAEYRAAKRGLFEQCFARGGDFPAFAECAHRHTLALLPPALMAAYKAEFLARCPRARAQCVLEANAQLLEAFRNSLSRLRVAGE